MILPGCEVDYYQPSEDNQGTGSSLFEDGVTVPAGFDWATIKAGKLTVTVDDRFNGKYYYQVEVFDTNPIFSPQARLLAKGVAKQGQNWVGAVDFPSDLEAVYVRQTSPTGQGVVKTVSISGENLSVDFTPKTGVQTRAAYQSQESSTVSMRSTEGPSTTYPTPAINGTSVFELSGEGNKAPSLWTSHAYVIPAGKTFRGSFDFNWTNSFIYIEGTWENTSANIELRGWTVIVQNGGKFINNADGGTFKLNSSSGSQLIVAAGGEFGKEGKLMTLSQDGDNDKIINSGTIQTSGMSNIRYLYNYGDINLSGKMNTYSSSTMVNKGNFIINNGTGDANALSLQGNFQNEGTVKISGTLNFPSNTFVLTNTGFFEVHTLGLSTPPGAQGTINNDGQFLITNEAAFELTFNIGAGGLLEARNLTMLNSTITLADNAMLTVTGRLTVSTSGVAKIIRGPAAGNALAKINEVAVPDYTNFELQGELEVECSNYQELPGSGTSDKGRTTGEDVRFVKVGESTVIIPASEYNKGGNDTSIPDTPPASPRFPIISEGLGLTYLFEDNWPYLGDYDMNDVVLDVQPIYETNEQNKVIQLTLQVTLRAAGASKRLAVGIQLDGITPGMISSITRSNTAGINGNVFTQSNGLETGQTYAVIPAFDDAHEALGHSSPLMTNTVKGSENNVSPRQVDFTIHFTTPLDQASISIDKLNAFIINGGYKVKRQEVHMAGFQPTDKADKSKFGLADDNSTEKPYTSKSNMIWGLAIPGPAKYPLEWTSIKVAYSGLENWATSGGALEKDWYKNPNQNIVYDK
ncbi:LruC domain-containing protein [uncultured Proteiniphilum sp.]|uniref:LruC domain-containing protein n=1 Tax=uncultured Proteiniphilum sp. TaxID=497637 RepID=UPI002635E3EF|nr:LruC domain-containing protein [uncultured Proteiniphilum sp.]